MSDFSRRRDKFPRTRRAVQNGQGRKLKIRRGGQSLSTNSNSRHLPLLGSSRSRNGELISTPRPRSKSVPASVNCPPTRSMESRLQKVESETEDELLTGEEWIQLSNQYGLSGQEWCVLMLTFQGLRRKEIRKELNISLDAVHKYCDRLHKKMKADDRVGLVLKVVRFVLSGRACH